MIINIIFYLINFFNLGETFKEKGINWLSDFLEHSTADQFWREMSNLPEQSDINSNLTNIDVPIFHIGSW